MGQSREQARPGRAGSDRGRRARRGAVEPRGYRRGGRVHDERVDSTMPDHGPARLLRAYAHLPSQRVPDRIQTLKLYLWSFRDRGIFAEDLAATLLKDLASACDPVEMTVDLTQQVRGGLDPDRGPPPSQNTRQLATSTCSSWRLPRMRVLPRFRNRPVCRNSRLALSTLTKLNTTLKLSFE